MRVRKAALLVLYDERGRILVQERGSHSKLGEEYGFFGGGIKPGESPEQAVAREAKEELGIRLLDPEFVGEGWSRLGDLVVYRHVFADRLENYPGLRVKEGRRARMVSLSEARRLKMVPGDEGVLWLMGKFLRSRRVV